MERRTVEKVGEKFRAIDKGGLGKWFFFDCPGCKTGHALIVGRPQHPVWTVAGKGDRLTFWPSLLYDGTLTGKRCHSFIKDGDIMFLADCYHALAGKTVPIPPYED